jgi:hypothetical protein
MDCSYVLMELMYCLPELYQNLSHFALLVEYFLHI